MCNSQSLGGSDGLGKPVESLVKAIASNSASALDEPGAAADGVESKLISDLGASEGTWKILLVGEDEKDGVTELFLSEHLVELLTVLFDSLSIVGVNDVDETLGVSVVMSPEKSDLVLTTDIPHIEADVFVFDGLDVEANSGDGVDDLSELELVEDGGLASGVKTDHEDSHLSGADHALPNFGK